MKKQLIQDIQSLTGQAENCLIVLAKGADLDMWSAGIGLQVLLRRANKQVVMVSEDCLPRKMNFLAGSQDVVRELAHDGKVVLAFSEDITLDSVQFDPELSPNKLFLTPKNGEIKASDIKIHKDADQFDVVFTIGANSLQNLGQIFSDQAHVFADSTVVQLTNDPGAESYGKYTVIDHQMRSVSELIFNYLVADSFLEAHIDADISTAFLTGLLSETDSFLATPIRARSFDFAARLQDLGARQSDVIDQLFKQKRFTTLKVWGQIFRKIQIDPVHRCGWVALTQSDLDQEEAGYDDIGEIARSILQYIDGIDVVSLIVPKLGGTEVQMRSSSPTYDFEAFLDTEYTNTRDGVDLFYKDGIPTDIESMLLVKLIDYQHSSLGLLGVAKLDIMTIEEKSLELENDISPATMTSKSKSEIAHAPTSVPFEVPTKEFARPEEKTVTTKSKKPKADMTLEVERQPSQRMPDWLKK